METGEIVMAILSVLVVAVFGYWILTEKDK